MAANQEAHPYEALAEQLGVAAATMRPDRAATITARALSGGVFGGLEAVQEEANTGTMDPTKIAMAVAAGAVLPATNKIGGAVVGAGESAAKRFVPGRPNVPVNPAADQVHVDAGASQAETAVGDSSTVQQPIRSGASTGNPQSAPERSSREYPKDNENTPPADDMLTQGDMDPATKQALSGASEGIAPEASPLGAQVEQPPQPAAPTTSDVLNRLQGQPSEPQAPEVAQAAPETTPPPQPEPVSDQAPVATPGAFDPDAYLAAPGTKVDAGFPEAGDPVAVGENEATPMPKRAAAIEVSKANASKPRLGLKKPEPAGAASSDAPNPVPDQQPSTDQVLSKLRGKTNPSPTDGQKEAGNYEKARERLMGREVAYENLKGSKRSGVGADGERWESDVPADYGYFRGTTGADKDHMDVYNLRNGDQHFIVDQRNPDTGKFDEHKVMANARDIDDARDTYLKGFSDDKALARLHDITPVDEDTLKTWLGGHGKSTKKPYGAPVAAVKPEPKVVTATVTKLRAQGMNELADKLTGLEPGKRVAEAARLNAMLASKQGKLPEAIKNQRIRPPAVEVPGAEGITARSKGDAEKKGAALKAARDVFDQHAPPDKEETKAETIERARRATIKAATLDKYPFKMQVKQEPAMWLQAAKQITKKPSDAKVAEFIATEKLLRSGDKDAIDIARKGNRIEADIGMSRRSGEAAITDAENKSARFDIPHEEAEEWVKPEPVKPGSKYWDDLVNRTHDRVGTPKRDRMLDMENPEHRAEIGRLFNKDVEETPKWKEVRDAKQKALQESVAKQLADRQAAAAVGDAAPVRKSEVKSLSDADKAKYAAMLDEANAKGKARGSAEHLASIAKDFMTDEKGSVDINKVIADLKASAGKLAGKIGRDYSHEPKSYTSKKIDTPQKEYDNSLSNELHKLDTEAGAHTSELLNWTKRAGKDTDKAQRERIYFAHEEGNLAKLSPEDRAVYDNRVKPMLDESEGVKHLINAIDPTKMGPDVLNHVYRIVKGQPGYDPLLRPEALRDPLGARNGVSQKAKGTALARSFVALERQDGARFVIQPNEKGYLLWTNGKALQIKDNNFKFKAGDTTKVGNNTLTHKDALTREIERNARGPDGKMMKYHHDIFLSAAAANKQLTELARNMSYLNELKNDPRFQARATTNPQLGNENEWEHPKLPELEHYWVDPMLKATLDDYAKPGIDGGRAVDWARRMSAAVTKTIYWNPVIHPMNVAGHWFVGRGWDNLNVKSLLKTSGPAIESVLKQDKLQKEIADAGGSTMYGHTLTKNAVQAFGKALGHEIESQPAVWDPIAKKLGVGPSTLVKAIYDNSSKIMWAANDMMYTQMYLEYKNKGMSPEGAVKSVEKDIPNYRVAPTLIGKNAGGRLISQVMQDPLLTSFGRYHVGIWNAYANTVNDLVRGSTGTQRIDAVGKLLALGALAFVAKPLMDTLAKKVTGNSAASEIPRGPLTIPADIGKAARGEDDIASALRATTTLSPMVSMLLQLMRNKDFGDRNIVEPGDVRNATHGSPKAALKVATQLGEFGARNTISPINIAENEAKKPNGGVVPALRDQLLGIKNPSPKATKFEAEAPKKAEQNAVSRQRAGGRGWAEQQVDKLGFK